MSRLWNLVPFLLLGLIFWYIFPGGCQGKVDYFGSDQLEVGAEPFQLRLSRPGVVNVTSLKVSLYRLNTPRREEARRRAAELDQRADRTRLQLTGEMPPNPFRNPDAQNQSRGGSDTDRISRERASLEKLLRDPDNYELLEERDGPTGPLGYQRPLDLGRRPDDFLMVNLLGECSDGRKSFKIKQRHWVIVLP